MTVDPGWTTGVCELTVDFSKGKTIKGLVRRGLATGRLLSYEVSGSVESQCWQIGARWRDVTKDLLLMGKTTLPRCYFACEDFDVRTLAADTVPLEIKGGLLTLMVGADPKRPNQTMVRPSCFTMQGPSMKSGCSNERLKRRGLWVGSPHERDARRHMVVLLDRVLNGDVG